MGSLNGAMCLSIIDWCCVVYQLEDVSTTILSRQTDVPVVDCIISLSNKIIILNLLFYLMSNVLAGNAIPVCIIIAHKTVLFCQRLRKQINLL